MGARIDLNADVGEAFGAWSMGADEALFDYVTSANVACGFHAGDPSVIDRTVACAGQQGRRDRRPPGLLRPARVRPARDARPRGRGRGRRRLPGGRASSPSRTPTARRCSHVKPHGALYNQAADDAELAQAIARGVARVDRGLVLVGLAGSRAMREAASAAGLRFAAEAFVDRAYDASGASCRARGRER